MKKMIALILAAVMVFALAGCIQVNIGPAPEGNAEEDSGMADSEAPEDMIVGGWTRADSPEVTDELRAVFEKAMEGFVGSDITPVALLATQLVAGTNYKFLCTLQHVVPDAPVEYAIVTVYEDLQGNAEITEILNSEAEALINELPGGWFAAEDLTITPEAKEAFGKATETLTGAEYTPIALLRTQVVAGMNYSMICEETFVIPHPTPEYVIITIYQDLEGNAEITETFEFAEE